MSHLTLTFDVFHFPPPNKRLTLSKQTFPSQAADFHHSNDSFSFFPMQLHYLLYRSPHTDKMARYTGYQLATCWSPVDMYVAVLPVLIPIHVAT